MIGIIKHIIGIGIYGTAAATGYHYHLVNNDRLKDKPNQDAPKNVSKKKQQDSVAKHDGGYDLTYIASKVKSYHDWPKQGIVYRDIFPALQDPQAFDMMIKRFCDHLQSEHDGKDKIDAIVGLDSRARGFLLGPVIAMRLNVPFVPVTSVVHSDANESNSQIRNKHKLPGECLNEKFEKAYGDAQLYIQKDSLQKGDSVIVVDDILSTGRTLQATNKLIKNIGCNVLENLVLIELDELKGQERLHPVPVFSLIHYDQ